MFTWYNFLELSNDKEYLALLGSWIHVNYTDVFWLFLLIFCIWSTLKSNSLRYKFLYFLLITGLLSVWGYWASLDGMMLLFLLTELLIILLFLLVFLSYNFFTEEEMPNIKSFYYMYIVAMIIYALSVPFAFGQKFSYYDFVYLYCLDIMTSEWVYFYFFFFVIYPTITIYIGTLLGIFSILFICIYFTLKRLQQTFKLNVKKISILRKQNFKKQALTKIQLQTFQL